MQIFCITLCVYDAILCLNRYQESELQQQPSVFVQAVLRPSAIQQAVGT